MAEIVFKDWMDGNHGRFTNLTDAVLSIVTNLLAEAGIVYLAVNGRTKSIEDCVAKAKRKNYKVQRTQMTDISGIRVIVYFEHDIEAVSAVIRNAFRVDDDNSRNKDELLSVHELGYRSVHFVCDLGTPRNELPEYTGLKDLKFEVQVRTILQHAWAELAHDRNYKFSGKLPQKLERKLYLLAGQLELTDTGFSELSKDIDNYVDQVSLSTEEGSLNIELNSLSLEEFVRQWAAKNQVSLTLANNSRDGYADLLDELRKYGVTNLEQLSNIIPDQYSMKHPGSTIYGFVRDWMILNDVKKFLRLVTPVNWVFDEDGFDRFDRYLSEREIELLRQVIGTTEEGYVEPDD